MGGEEGRGKLARGRLRFGTPGKREGKRGGSNKGRDSI